MNIEVKKTLTRVKIRLFYNIFLFFSRDKPLRLTSRCFRLFQAVSLRRKRVRELASIPRRLVVEVSSCDYDLYVLFVYQNRRALRKRCANIGYYVAHKWSEVIDYIRILEYSSEIKILFNFI